MPGEIVRVGDDYSIKVDEIKSIRRVGSNILIERYSGGTDAVSFDKYDDPESFAIEAFEDLHWDLMAPEERRAENILDNYSVTVTKDEACPHPECPNTIKILPEPGEKPADPAEAETKAKGESEAEAEAEAEIQEEIVYVEDEAIDLDDGKNSNAQ